MWFRARIILLLVMVAALHAHAITVTTTAGKLATVVPDHNITSLTINGTIDARDFKFIADELTNLKTLELTNATIEAYSGTVDDGFLSGVLNFNANTLPHCALMGLVKLQSVTLPSNLVAIDYGALAGTGITSITFPGSVKSIGDDAFNSCKKLTNVTLSYATSHLGANAFAHCDKLAKVVISIGSPLKIGDGAFADCKQLSSVSIGHNVVSVGAGAFRGCTSLQSVSISDGSLMEEIGDKAFYMSGLKKFDFSRVPRLKHLGAWALAKTNITRLELPSHVKQLDEGTLFYNKNLNKVELPSTLTYLPNYMLAGCDNINNPAGFMTQHLGDIGDYALYNQSQHSTINIPYGVYRIGTRAMAGMTGLNEISAQPLQVPELGDDVWAGINQNQVRLNVNKDVANAYKAADQWMNFLIGNATLRGDVNEDGFVNTIDAVAERLFLTDGNTQGINTSLTDVSGDGEVNVGDIVSIYNIINSTEPFNKPYHTYFDDLIDGYGDAITGKTVSLNIILENTINYTAFQLDISTPSHISINSATLTSRALGHELHFKQVSPNYYSLWCYSPAGDDIDGYEGALLTLEISSTSLIGINDKIDLQEINFVDQQEIVYRRHQRSLNLMGSTAIDNITADESSAPVNVYNTQGQLIKQNVDPATATQGLPQGIYIIGGKKVIVR